MRTCPYCLYRFPDDAPGCPRCENTLPALAPRSKNAPVRAAAMPALPALPALPSRNWRPLAIGGAAIVVVAILAIFVAPRLFGGKPAAPPRPQSGTPSSQTSVQATAVAGFPTQPPPSGWREWLVADNRLKVWLPDMYQVVNFSDSDWQNVYSTTLAQNSYLSSIANKAKSGLDQDTLLAGVSSPKESALVRVQIVRASMLAGSEHPGVSSIQPIVSGLGIGGELANIRNRDACGTTQMTQVEVIPPKLDDPSAWRGFVLAATEPGDGYLMIMLVSPRDFPTVRNTLERALGSLCGLQVVVRPTVTPRPSPTMRLTATPVVMSSTPKAPEGWQEWRVRDTVRLWLPKTFNTVDFTNVNWQKAYSATLTQDEYIRAEASKVKSGDARDTMLIATTPSTATISMRVVLVNALNLAGTEPPAPASVQAIADSLGVKGRLGKVSTPKACGAQITRMDIIPPAASPWGGSVLAVNSSTRGYVLIALVSPQQATDDEALNKVLASLCIIAP